MGMLTKLTEFEATKAKLEADLAAAPASVLGLHPGMAEIYRTKVEGLAPALKDPDLRDEALGMLRDLVDAVIMHRTHPAGAAWTR